MSTADRGAARRWRRALVAVLALLATAAVPTVRAAAAPPAGLDEPGQAPAGAIDLGEAGPDTPLQLTLTLPSKDRAGLDAFVAAVSTPGTAVYGHYLTPAQFADRFGATDAAVAEARRGLD